MGFNKTMGFNWFIFKRPDVHQKVFGIYCGLGYFGSGFIFALFAQKVNARN